MPFDDERFWGRESVPKLSPIGAFVMTKSFGFDAGIAGVFHELRIDDQQPSPFRFFWARSRT